MALTGGQLRDARDRAGLSQAELADQLGVSLKTVSNWELGKRPITREASLRDLLDIREEEPTVSIAEQLSDAQLVAEIARRLALVDTTSLARVTMMKPTRMTDMQTVAAYDPEDHQ